MLSVEFLTCLTPSHLTQLPGPYDNPHQLWCRDCTIFYYHQYKAGIVKSTGNPKVIAFVHFKLDNRRTGVGEIKAHTHHSPRTCEMCFCLPERGLPLSYTRGYISKTLLTSRLFGLYYSIYLFWISLLHYVSSQAIPVHRPTSPQLFVCLITPCDFFSHSALVVACQLLFLSVLDSSKYLSLFSLSYLE